MTKFTIHYERKVQVRQHEMLTIGLTVEYDTKEYFMSEAYAATRKQVDKWIDDERRRLQA